jgi:hypothetical protein
LEGISIKRNSFKLPCGGLCGFALILFHYESDANKTLKKYGSDPLFPFPLRTHQWIPDGAREERTERAQHYETHICEEFGMPSLLAQLEPLTETQLRKRLTLLNHPSDVNQERIAYKRNGRLGKKLYLKTKLASLYRSKKAPRVLRSMKGTPLPLGVVEDLLSQLRKTAWGPSTRKGMAEHFLVLGKSSHNAPHVVHPHHQQLWDSCIGLLHRMGVKEDALGTGFSCTSIGVTKNFRGSPHVDSKDATFQFAVSLGSFDHETGGELCVERGDGGEIVMINTFQSIAKLDGRYIHWVRDFSGSERYSIIWFCVDPERRTQPERSVYENVVAVEDDEDEVPLSAKGSEHISTLRLRVVGASVLLWLAGATLAHPPRLAAARFI